MMPRSIALAAALSLVVIACSAPESTLQVRVYTGLVAGPEFRIVQTSVLAPRTPTPEIFASEALAYFGNDFARGRTVATYSVPDGDYRVRVRLLRPSGELLVERIVALTMSGDTVLPVHLTRDCVGVRCPAPGGSPSFSTCLAGRCVDPSCSVDHPQACPTFAFCNDASECSTPSSCAAAVCEEGVCSQQAVVGSCDANQWCNPDVGAGCQPLMPDQPAPSVCGTICTDAATPCQFGYWSCESGSPVCTPLQNRPRGYVCGVGRSCDVEGECVVPSAGTPGVVVAPTSGLVTSESGGTASFTVVLSTAPTAEVVFDLSTSDASEGVSPSATLRFSSATWNVAQTVIVAGVDDGVTDGNMAYTIAIGAAASTDTAYAGLDPDDVSLINVDDEIAGVLFDTSNVATSENGASAAFTIRLTVTPSADVTIPISVDDESEIEVSPASLVFTPEDYDTPHVVTVTGVDDAVADGDQTAHVVIGAAVSVDVAYGGYDAADITATNADDDVAGVVIDPTSGLFTIEDGSFAVFEISLATEPLADVTIELASSDATEGADAVPTLVFTPSDWNIPQTAGVVGVDDSLVDGDIAYTVSAMVTSEDTNYNALAIPDLELTNFDDDAPGIFVSPTSRLQTTEEGGTDSFTIRLASEPSADVTIAISSSDTAAGTVSPSSVTFTPANWDMAQTVVVTGVSSVYLDGDVLYTVITAPATSADPNYNTRNADDVSVTNIERPCTTLHFDPRIVVNVGGGPVEVVTGDFNNDGNLDFAVSHYTDMTIGVVLGNGDGTFNAPATYSTGAGRPWGLVAVDFNRDGKLDLASATSTGHLSLLLNLGSGTFGAASTFAGGTGGSALVAADLNRDGNQDVAMVDQFGSGLQIFFGTGTGSFMAPTTYALALGTRIVALDIDHDGDLDLFAVGWNGVVWHRNDGHGVFDSGTGTSSGSVVAFSTVTAELTGDAWPDVVVLNHNEGQLATFEGTGSALSLSDLSSTNTTPRAVTAADFDRDGKIDMAVANVSLGRVSIALGLGDGRFDRPTTYPSGTSPYGITSGDFNNDGHLDVATADNSSNTVSILLGRGGIGSDGTFQAARTANLAPSPESVSVADFNQDGRADLLSANPSPDEIRVALANSSGDFPTSTAYTSGAASFPSTAYPVDLNHDSFPDVAVALLGSNAMRVHLNNGDGTFGPGANYAAGTNARDFASGDFNRDGNIDVASANVNGGSVSVLLGVGDGSFAAAVDYAVTAPRRIQTADLNHDGALDLISTCTFGTSGLCVQLGVGTGVFGAASTFTTGTDPADLTVADFNHDGHSDALLMNRTSEDLGMMVGDGTGAFTLSAVYPAGNLSYAISNGDFNDDGHADAVIVDGIDSTYAVYLGQGDGTLAAPLVRSTVSGPNAVAVGDVNRDGHEDVIISSATLSAVSVYRANRLCLP